MTDKPIKATLDSLDDSVKTQKPILIQLDDIPTPTDADAGKVLGVDDEGKYALTEGGGGGNSLDILIKCTNDHAPNVWSLSATDYKILSGTISNVIDKWENGQLIEGRLFVCEHDYDDEEDTSYDNYYTASLTQLDCAYPGSVFDAGQMNLHFFDASIKRRIILAVDDTETILTVTLQNF